MSGFFVDCFGSLKPYHNHYLEVISLDSLKFKIILMILNLNFTVMEAKLRRPNLKSCSHFKHLESSIPKLLSIFQVKSLVGNTLL